MTDDTNPTLRALHDLVATCNDGAEGYAKAAKIVRDGEITNWLMDRSNDRERFASELSYHLSTLGGSARNDLHEGGILHRGWVDLEQSLRPKSTPELLRECLAGEEGTIKHYDHALSLGLPSDIQTVVQTQRSLIEHDMHYLRTEGHVRSQGHAV